MKKVTIQGKVYGVLTAMDDETIYRYAVPVALYESSGLEAYNGSELIVLPEEIRDGIECGDFEELDENFEIIL